MFLIDRNLGAGIGIGGFFVAMPSTCECCGKMATRADAVGDHSLRGYCDEHARIVLGREQLDRDRQAVLTAAEQSLQYECDCNVEDVVSVNPKIAKRLGLLKYATVIQGQRWWDGCQFQRRPDRNECFVAASIVLRRLERLADRRIAKLAVV